MAEDEVLQRGEKNGIVISRSPTPSEGSPTSSKIKPSPTPHKKTQKKTYKKKKKGTTLTINSNGFREEKLPTKPIEHPSQRKFFSNRKLQQFEPDSFPDERTMQVHMEIQRARAEGEMRNQEYEFIMAQRAETQRMNPAYQGWMGLPHPVDAGIRREVRPVMDPYALQALNEQYNRHYPFSPNQTWESEENASFDNYDYEGEANGGVPEYAYNISAPNGFNGLDGAFDQDQARLQNSTPEKLDPTALAFKPSLALRSASAPAQTNGQILKSTEQEKLNPAALSFSPRRKPETPSPLPKSSNNDLAPSPTPTLNPTALSFSPRPKSEASLSLYSHASHGHENAPSEDNEGSVASVRKVKRMITRRMYRNFGNPATVSWDGKAVLLRMKGGLYSAHLTYVGPCDDDAVDESVDGDTVKSEAQESGVRGIASIERDPEG